MNIIEMLEYIEFATNTRCVTYNGKDCDANTQAAYEEVLDGIREHVAKVIEKLKSVEFDDI